MPNRRAPRPQRQSEPDARNVVDLERYVPAFLTWIANKLSRGASQHYLSVFDVGIAQRLPEAAPRRRNRTMEMLWMPPSPRGRKLERRDETAVDQEGAPE